MATVNPTPSPPPRPARYDTILDQIGKGVWEAKTNLRRRTNLLTRLEREGEPQPRRVAMYYSSLESEITHADILPFTSMLKRIGRIQNLDLIIHSPGGDGLTAEKMLDLCRKYCTGKLRIVVPLYAKSAATLIALGGNEILVGETSELGPIDAQVFIIQDGAPQQVSADHFLRAEQEAIDRLGSTRPEEQEASRISLASLSPAMLQHCRDLQNFAKDCAGKQLRTHMFGTEYAADQTTWDERISKIVDNLTASGRRLSHGRMITAADIQADPDLQHLKVRALAETDPYWMCLDDLLQRTDLVAKSENMSKVLFARGFQMIASSS